MSDLCPHENSSLTNKENIIVYWSTWANEETWSFYNLVKKSPFWLPQDHLNLHTDKKRGQALLHCPAHQSAKTNTLVLNFPIDIHIVFDEKGIPIVDNKYARFVNRNFDGSDHDDKMTNRYYIQFAGAPIFFCEDDLEMEIFPPYLHDVSATQYGALTVGKFNIGKWFRPIYFDYMLWSGKREIILKENDPAMYIRFHTNKRIILQEFKSTNFIYSTGRACESVSRQYKDRQSLQERYDLFGSGSTKKALLQEIRTNLL